MSATHLWHSLPCISRGYILSDACAHLCELLTAPNHANMTGQGHFPSFLANRISNFLRV